MSIALGTALLVLLTGCQTTPRAVSPLPSAQSAPSAPPPPVAAQAYPPQRPVPPPVQAQRPAPPMAPPQRPEAAAVQPRQAVSPAAWKTAADRWVGVKYRKGGVDRAGIDCSGLSSRMYLEVAGVALPRTVRDQSRCGNAVARKELRAGDLVFFIALKPRTLDHVGIYLGDSKFVHASPSKGVVVSTLLNDYYKQRFHSARRIVP